MNIHLLGVNSLYFAFVRMSASCFNIWANVMDLLGGAWSALCELSQFHWVTPRRNLAHFCLGVTRLQLSTCVSGWLDGWVIAWVNWLTDWVADWLTDWLSEWPNSLVRTASCEQPPANSLLRTALKSGCLPAHLEDPVHIQDPQQLCFRASSLVAGAGCFCAGC